MKKVIALVLLAVLVLATGVFAQEAALTAPEGFPGGPITIIVPQSAGGGTDTGVRLLMKYAQAYFNEPIVVQNLPGGSTVVGVTEAMKKDTDGLTVIQFASASVIAFEAGKQFDIANDFDYLSLQTSDPRVLCFRPDDERFSTTEELFAYIKEHPGELTIGVTGVNNASHIHCEMMVKASGLDITIIGFDGQATIKPAFLGKDIDLMWQAVSEAKPMVSEKQCVAAFVCSEDRVEADLPGTPTAKELGIDLVAASNRGYVYKKGVPAEITQYMASVFEAISKDPAYIEEMANLGLANAFLGPKDYEALCLEEQANYAEVMKDLGII